MKEAQQPLVTKETEEVQQPKPQNLESYIRDSIFGDDFRNYDEKFAKLTQELESIRQSIA